MSNLKIYLYEIFYVLTGALVFFAFFETVCPGIVLAYININWVLILWLIDAIFILLVDYSKQNKVK